jgi:hypothetical protein
LNIIGLEGFLPVHFGLTDLNAALSDKYKQIKLSNCVTACCTVPLVPATQQERTHRKQKLATQNPFELLDKEFEAK